jgi:hypothetical protein
VADNNQERKLLDFRAINVTTTPTAISVLLIVAMLNAPEYVIARERKQVGEFLNQDGSKLAHPTILAAMTDVDVKMLPVYSWSARSFVPISVRETGMKGTLNETREEAYSRTYSEPASSS